MNLYLIIYMWGEIAMAAGPLPYDMAECERRRDEYVDFFTSEEGRADLKAWAEKNPEQTLAVDDIKVECLESETKPVVKNPVQLGD